MPSLTKLINLPKYILVILPLHLELGGWGELSHLIGLTSGAFRELSRQRHMVFQRLRPTVQLSRGWIMNLRRESQEKEKVRKTKNRQRKREAPVSAIEAGALFF